MRFYVALSWGFMYFYVLFLHVSPKNSITIELNGPENMSLRYFPYSEMISSSDYDEEKIIKILIWVVLLQP